MALPGTQQQFRRPVQLQSGSAAPLGMRQHNQEQDMWLYAAGCGHTVVLHELGTCTGSSTGCNLISPSYTAFNP